MAFYDAAIVYNCALMQLNIYNLNKIIYRRRYKLSSCYNTYGDITNRKVNNLYNYFGLLTNQRCCLVDAPVSYYRKKIIKGLRLNVSLNKRNGLNLLKYLYTFYIYFFNIYYQSNLKYSFLPTFFQLHLDNSHSFFKSYSKQNQNVRFNFFLNKIANKGDFIYLNNHFLITL